MEPKAARDNLSTALSLLRRQLEIPGVSADRLLIADYQNVRLNAETITTDVEAFERLLNAAARTEENAVRKNLLERAVGLYRGDLLPTCYEEWAVQEQARLRTRYGDALQHWAFALAQAGDLEAALIAAQRARQADPYREESYRAQMWLHAALGRPALALETYRELEAFFRSDLGITPSAATRTLAERLRHEPDRFAARQNIAWSLAPSLPWLQEVDRRSDEAAEGSRRSRRGPEPVPLPQTTPTERRVVCLPPQFTPFFGREEERSRLQELLTLPREEEGEPSRGAPSSPRLITVTGPGGVGKTRFAIEVAGQMAEAFGGRVWFVPLAEVPTPAMLPFALAKALELASTRDSNPLERVVERLIGTDCLLVVDNFEHLLRDAHSVLKGDHPQQGSSTAYVRQLLERIPGLRCLVTSRQPLHLSGEQEFPIGPLPTPAERQSPAQLMTYSSVVLFWNRARAVKPDFALTAQNAEAVAALCRKLEGMPLAIEMTAAWIRTLPPARLLERLEHQLDLLVNRRSDLPPRHQSLRATIEWSYGLLPPELQTAFTCLSVFRNGWTLQAAEAILASDIAFSRAEEGFDAPPSVLETLAQLQERSLLVAEEQGDEIRYRLLVSLREFALERQAANGTGARIQARHADYFLALMERAIPMFDGPERPAALRLCAAEPDNVLAALDWYLTRETDLEKAFRLASAMTFFWTSRGYWNERRLWLEGLASRTTSRTEARARALIGAGNLARDEEDYERAQARIREALDIMQEVDCRQGIAIAILTLGAIATSRQHYAEAEALYAESLSRLIALNDQRNIAFLYYHLGELFYKQGDFSESRRVWERCCAIEQEQKIIGGGVLWALGRLLRETGDYAAARPIWRRHLLERCQTGGLSGIMTSLEEHALLAAAQGQHERAGRLWGAAATLRTSLGSQVSDSRAEIKEYEERTAHLRAVVGANAFETAFEAGYALTREQAIAYALEDSTA
jgi:non-specific serine/threonine protein kinase